jgi:hypothetical protein
MNRRIIGSTLAVVAVALGLAASAPAVTPPAFEVTLHVPGHHPKANKKWPVTVTATSAEGKALKGTLRYAFLYKGRVVSRQSNYHFKGTYTDKTFVWPSRAIGIPLKLRCQITTSLGTRYVDYAVRVRS